MARIAWMVHCAVVLLAACASGDPNAELEGLIEEAERAAEARDTGYFRGLISDDYVDRRGRTRDEVINLVRGYFLVNARVDVVIRIARIDVVGGDTAEVSLEAALLGRAEGRSLLGTDADLYRLDLELVKDGSRWRVIGADWARALE